MRQVARKLVKVDERLGRKDKLEAALQLLEAEPALRKMLVQLGRETVTVRVRSPRAHGTAVPGA
jgi:hypothetical protein